MRRSYQEAVATAEAEVRTRVTAKHVPGPVLVQPRHAPLPLLTSQGVHLQGTCGASDGVESPAALPLPALPSSPKASMRPASGARLGLSVEDQPLACTPSVVPNSLKPRR